MTGRLDRDTVLPAGLEAPVLPTQAGILHIGVGAFHRAHQAVYTQDAMRRSGDLRWGIVGTTQRSRSVVDELVPQGGLYSVLTAGDENTVEVIGSIVDVLSPATDTRQILGVFTAPDTHIVTVTVTEAGYPTDAARDLDRSAVEADLEALVAEAADAELGAQASTSMVGLLARGLVARHRAGGAPITVISCDNINGNGQLLGALVTDAIRAAVDDAEVLAWLEARVAFPDTMVDRIAPAPTEAVRAEVEAVLGTRDEGAVVAEPFSQWVLEDRFVGPRPPWELAGATFTSDVAPFEHAKLRLLNGTHSVLAYAGAVRGCRTIDEAMNDPVAGALAEQYLFGDAVPSTTPPEGLDLVEYARTLTQRFANPALGHTVQKVAMDGSLKIPLRWVPVAEARLHAGDVPVGVAAATAAYVQFLLQRHDLVADPRRAELLALAAEHPAAHDLLDALLGSETILPASVAGNAGFVEAAHDALEAWT